MKLNKPTAIFNTPRAGSSILCRILLKDNPTFYTGNLSCYFCGDSIAHIDPQGNLKLIYSHDLDTIPNPGRKEMLAKLSVLKALDPQRYVMKFSIANAGIWENGRKIIPEEVWSYMLEHYDFIILRRRNLLDQILSRGLVVCTKLWHHYTDIDNPEWPVIYRERAFQKEAYERTYIYPREEFIAMCWLIEENDRLGYRIPEEKKIPIYYEDMEEELISRSKEFNLVQMPYPRDKLDLFQNKEEILEWYGKWEEKRSISSLAEEAF